MNSDDNEEVYLNSEEARVFDFHLLKAGNDLFKESDYKIQRVINVKRVTKKKDKSEDWHIIDNKETVLILKGIRFSNQEKEFFRTVDGMKFIINGYKCGLDSVVKFKNKLKEFYRK